MITSANAPNAVNGQRYTPARRNALIAGGAASGGLLGAAYGGRSALKAHMERLRERITGKPNWVTVNGKRMPSHGIKPIWIRGSFKEGRTQQVLAKHGASMARLRAALSNPAWRRARKAGMIGVGATGATAGVIAALPPKRR